MKWALKVLENYDKLAGGVLIFLIMFEFFFDIENELFQIVLYISAGDRFVHFFSHRLFYHSILDLCNEELMIG